MPSMARNDLFSALRQQIGNPTVNEVADRTLIYYLERGLEWLATELEYSVVLAQNNLALTAGKQTYAIPAEVARILWVEYAPGHQLVLNSMFHWDHAGVNWRSAPAGTVREVAVLGQNFLLLPAPDAAFVASYPALTYWYYRSQPGLTQAGTPELFDNEQILAIYYAAVRYLGQRPKADPDGRMKGDNEEAIQALLPAAKLRRQNLLMEFYPSFQVGVRRGGAAR